MYFSVFLIPSFVRATCLLWLFAFDFTPTSITAQKLPSSSLCRLPGIDGKGGCDDSFSALGSGHMHQRGCSTLKHVHEKGQVLNRGIHMKSRCCIKSSVSLWGMIEELEMLWGIACVSVLWRHQQQMALQLQRKWDRRGSLGFCSQLNVF